MAEDPIAIPLSLDTDARCLGHFVVLDRQSRPVGEFDTLVGAEAFIAEANGSDPATARAEWQHKAAMLDDYRATLRRERRST